MAVSIKNLRRSVVAGGAALLAVLLISFGIARFKGGHFSLDLPGRLGVDISQTANGFTYSQSQKGHTLFTIHASKLVQYKGDQAELHDVTITLYGPEGSGRSDKIYGSDFKYDRKLGIARASGGVQIDFAAPDGGAARKPDSDNALKRPQTPGEPPTQPPSTIHVTTSGVVFDQKTGEASTEERVDFVLPRAAGSAIGADYNSKDGVLVLGRQVALTTSGQGATPAGATIHAEHAQLLRAMRQAYLIKAEASSSGRRTTSDQATVTFRPDGSAEQIDARGHVHAVAEDGAEVHASDAIIGLDAQSLPLKADLSGGVTYYANQDGGTMQGAAVSGTLTFVAQALPASAGKGEAPGVAPKAALHHAQFRDAVTFVLQQHSLNGDPNGSSTREMRAGKLDIDFAQGADGRSEAQHVLGTGGAMANLHDVPSKGPSRATSISGEQLLATLVHGREFKLLDGKGNTKIVDSTTPGATSTSTGDALQVTFASAETGAGSGETAKVDTAVQSGSVVLSETPAPDAKNADGSPQTPLHATAQQAEYHAGSDLLQLSGDPHLKSDTLALAANRVDYHRDSGDAAAFGEVKATYVAGTERSGPSLGGDGPVHVTADHAQLTRSSNISVFYGGPAGALPARLWQGADAVAAPVLELARDQQTLDAHGVRGDHAPVVHATLGSKAASDRSGPATATNSAASGQAGAPARITCETLHYSDKDHRVDLHGSVTAEQPSGTLHADDAQVFLTASTPNQPSQLDRTVATGHVVITQPGRRGTGDKLVYTAATGQYVLTGSPAQPPRIADAQRGTTSGAALLFKAADDSVEVSSYLDHGGGPTPAGGRAGSMRTVTDTHTPK